MGQDVRTPKQRPRLQLGGGATSQFRDKAHLGVQQGWEGRGEVQMSHRMQCTDVRDDGWIDERMLRMKCDAEGGK
jgi:hypothetical protein